MKKNKVEVKRNEKGLCEPVDTSTKFTKEFLDNNVVIPDSYKSCDTAKQNVKPVMGPVGMGITYPGLSELSDEQKEARKIMYNKNIVLKFKKVKISSQKVKEHYTPINLNNRILILDQLDIVRCDYIFGHFEIYNDIKGEFILFDLLKDIILYSAYNNIEFYFNEFGMYKNRKVFKIYLEDSLNTNYVGECGDYEIVNYLPRPENYNITSFNEIEHIYLSEISARYCIEQGYAQSIDKMKTMYEITFKTFKILRHKPTGDIATLD